MVKSARQRVAPITPVKELHDNRSDWRIRVRLCRKWVVPQYGKTPPTLELLFVDAKGDRIQATIKAHLFETFQKYLKENVIFLVSHFSVVENKGNFPVTDHRYKIWFHTDTLIVETVSLSFPLSVYKFKSFPDIKVLGHSDDNPLFDVIGHVANDGERSVQQGSAGGKHNVEVMLEDLEKNKISLTLWEPYAKEFQDAYSVKTDGYFVVIVQLCRTKEFRGEIGLSNTYHATKLIFKESEIEIDDYKQRLPPLQENSSQVSSQRSESSFKGVTDDVENLAVPVLSLQQIKELKYTGKFWVVATMSEVIAEKGWFYNSCSKCRKKVVEADEKFHCEKCRKDVVGVPRFKVHVRVVDGFSLEFLLFDHVASILLGNSAAAIANRVAVELAMKEDGRKGKGKIVASPLIPVDVDCLIGKEAMFKVIVERKHLEGRESVYVVDKVCLNGEVIDKHKVGDHLRAIPTTVATDLFNAKKDDMYSVSESSKSDSDNDAELDSPYKLHGKRLIDEFDEEGQCKEDDCGSTQRSSSSMKRRLLKAVVEDNED